MRPSAAGRILPLCASLFLTLCGVARADRIREETGRELLAPDGRTLIDKQDGFSIVLPASNWKVHLDQYPPYTGDAGFTLYLAPPDGEARLRIHGKINPFPVPLERLQKLMTQPEPRTRSQRSEFVSVAGMKCLENEQEAQMGERWIHRLGRLCNARPGLQFSVEIYPGVPVDQWPAEEKVLRELVESFRILR
jgi:hypothetical protein